MADAARRDGGGPHARRRGGARQWELVCFPPGPDGAHKVTNRGADTVRVLMLSTKPEHAVAVYPDSGKVLATTPHDRLMSRRSSAVDYYDGEV